MNTLQTLSEHFKYFKGEKENPFEVGTTSALWWNGEKQLYNTVENDDGYLDAITDEYEKALRDNQCSGALIDKKLPLTSRAIIFYLDLWHGRYFPYDSLDVIHTY